ncbi:hypothetical protein [Campylobacter curvus]|uniref:hypothetical protein n=1 Tax=Campylobacter curvus TaxID=200 RepID=UPI000382433D|nr:hypothetical protein [Campylobacter curvus]UEB50530.1 hypothetical protein LK426_03510 [Campylobacter curvus]
MPNRQEARVKFTLLFKFTFCCNGYADISEFYKGAIVKKSFLVILTAASLAFGAAGTT